MEWTTLIPERQADYGQYRWWRKQSQPGSAIIVFLDKDNRLVDPRGPGFNRTIAAEDLGGEWGDGPILKPEEPDAPADF